jgi:hypothetical protein
MDSIVVVYFVGFQVYFVGFQFYFADFQVYFQVYLLVYHHHVTHRRNKAI